jgi:hypothetical protein
MLSDSITDGAPRCRSVNILQGLRDGGLFFFIHNSKLKTQNYTVPALELLKNNQNGKFIN